MKSDDSPERAPSTDGDVLVDARCVRALDELLGAGLFVGGADRLIRGFSPTMERLTGSTAAAAYGRHCLHAIRCPTCLPGCGLLTYARSGPREVTLYTRAGVELRVIKSGIVLRDAAGGIAGGAGGRCGSLPARLAPC